MSRFRSIALLAFAVAFTGTVVPAWAQQQGRGQGNGNGQPPAAMRGDDRRFQAPPPPPPAPARDRTMSESVRWAQKTAGGQVLGAERVQSDGRDFNRVKLMDERGRVRYMDDVPQSRQPARTPQQPPAGERRPPSGQ